jgi:fructokinase
LAKLIAIGEALIDFMPLETGVDLADVSCFEKAPGGAPSNVAACAARLGTQAMVITKLGVDGFGDFLVKALRDSGVDVSAVVRTKEAPTGLAFVSLKADGEREFLFYRSPSADMLLRWDEVSDTWFKEGDVLHFCSVALGAQQMRDTHRMATRVAAERGMFISFDVNLRFPLWPDKEELRKTVFEFIPGVDLLKTGAEELLFLSGGSPNESKPGSLRPMSQSGGELRAYVERMLEITPALLVTYGSNGAELFLRSKPGSAGRSIFHKGYDTPAVDTTGAGDAFVGSFLASIIDSGARELSLFSDKELLDMLERAHATASLVVAKKGAINSMPDLQQVNRFMFENIL